MKFYKKIIFFFLIFAAFQGFSQNTLDNVGLTSSTPASVAYSLRKLSSSYVGFAIQVRRSNDNATQDIGFTSGGDLDTSALLAFVGSNNGFVTIWYDQSGNGRNLTQTNLSRQPSIINKGVIYRRNSLPTIYHDNVDDGMLYSGSNYLTVNPLSVNIVASSNSNNVSYRRAVQGTNNWLIGPYNNQHSWYASGWNHQINSAWSLISLETFTIIQPVSNPNTSFRNSAAQTAGNNRGLPNKLQTGVEGAYPEPLDGFLSEILVFSSEISAINRNTFENNQRLYYSICLLATQPSANNQSVILGGTATSLSVLSNDDTANYQWYSNTENSNTGGAILSGETNKNFVPSTAVEGTLYYYAVISTTTTSCSSNISGYVRVGIEITSQPSASNQTVIQNSPVNSLNVVATGSSISYQWYKNVSKTNTAGTLISGAITNSYTPLSTDLGTSYYYVAVSGNNTVLVSNPSGAIKITTTPIIWDGPIITFGKANYADFSQVQNQDVLTNTIKITRANDQGLFNIATESSFGGSSPSNTEWAEGLLSSYTTLNYKPWQQAVSYYPPFSVNKTYVVHLIAENIFLELKVLSWTDSGNGGGFSYSRTSPCTLPSEPTASNQSLNSPATVADLVATGTNIKWYLADTGGISLQTNAALTSGTYYVTQTVNSCESARKPITVTIISCSAPTLSNFNNNTKIYFDVSYSIIPPSSNSSGVFTYTSSNLAVATISGTIVNIVGPGSTTITATQDADGSYCGASVTSTLTINTVSVINKNGQVSTTNFNFINKNGAVGVDFGLNKNGMIIQTKSYDLSTALVMHLDAGNTSSYSGSGTIWTDLSGLGNNGTLINNPVYNSSNGGNLVFNGSNTYVNAPLTKTASCTFSVWAKSINTNSNKMLLNAGNDGAGPDLFFSGNVLSWNTWDSSNNPFGNIPATSANGNWHNYVVVNDAVSNTAKVYYDGVFYGAAIYKNASANNKLYIGGTTGGYQWDGAIGNVQVHNRVLTPAEVAQNFNYLKTRYGL